MDYKQGIDVSKWQGVVDWAKVKAAGVDFAMLRAGYGQGTADSEFAKNAAGCEAAGLPYGVYWFSYAYSAETAAAEAAWEQVRLAQRASSRMDRYLFICNVSCFFSKILLNYTTE